MGCHAASRRLLCLGAGGETGLHRTHANFLGPDGLSRRGSHLRFKCGCAAIHYVFLAKWRGKSPILLTLPQLRLQFHIPEDLYLRNANFLQGVVGGAIKEINEKAECSFRIKMTEIREKKAPTEGVIFYILPIHAKAPTRVKHKRIESPVLHHHPGEEYSQVVRNDEVSWIKRKSITCFFAVVLLLSSILLCYMFTPYFNFWDNQTVNAAETKVIPLIKTAESQILKPVVISFAGDCTLGTDNAFGYEGTLPAVLAANNNDPSYIFKNVKDIFMQDDLTVVNLEGALTAASIPQVKTFNFKGPAWYAKILKTGGIDYVNLANNHTFDYLQNGYNDTLAALKNENIGYFGENNVAVKTINNIGVGLLGYYSYSEYQTLLHQIKADIANLRSTNCKLIVVGFHWGIENSYTPNSAQTALAHYAIDSGADLIIGHHPHVLQGVEIYKGKAIFYSLGNFAFGGNKNPIDKDTVIVQLRFEPGMKDYQLRLIPCSVSSLTDANNYQPTPLTGKEKDRVLQKFNDLALTNNFKLSTEYRPIR